MKKTVMFVLVLCLCFAAFSPAFAETAVTEAPAAEELYQAGRDAVDAGDYGKAKEYFQLAADAGNAEGWRGIGNLYADGLRVEQSYEKAKEYYHSTTCFLTVFPDQFIIRFEDSGEDTWDILFVSD